LGYLNINCNIQRAQIEIKVPIAICFNLSMISNQIDFFIPRIPAFYADCCRPRPPPQRGRFYGPLLVFTFPKYTWIYTYVFLRFLCHTRSTWFFFLGWQLQSNWVLGFLLVRLALVFYLRGFGFYLICMGCLHISTLIYCGCGRGKCPPPLATFANGRCHFISATSF